jgi:hypothetical protein
MGVVNAPGSVRMIGAAHATGWVAYRRGPVTTFRLMVNGTKLPGLWVCIGRRFLHLVDAAEEL